MDGNIFNSRGTLVAIVVGCATPPLLIAPWNVRHGAAWLQTAASLPVAETHNTLCALTGLAENNSTIVKSEAHNRMIFLMILPQMVLS